MDAIIIKPAIDSKGESSVVSRLGIDRRVDLLVKKDDDIFSLIESKTADAPLHCILIDEVQFLEPKQIDQLFKVAVLLDVPVIAYGLRTDFKLNGFPASERLLLLAHSVEELKTICRCGRKAVFNARKIDGEFVSEGSQVAIDGENHVEYESLCGQCYFKLVGDVL